MRNIKKITKTLAGSALLVGATLAGAASMGAAQSSGSSGSLGEYPSQFIDEDGMVDTTVVVGESAKSADVLGATSIAAGLGNAAFTTESVSVGGFGWSATEGVTLNTRNDDLYFGDEINAVRKTLTQDELNVLSETTFRDDGGDETDVTNYLNVGKLEVTFSNDAEELDNEDPEVYVSTPTSVGASPSDHLYNLQANFEDTLDFTDSEVAGEEITLFGTTYTIAEDNKDNTDELLLYGSSETVSVSTDEEPSTISIDGEEVTIGVEAVTGSDTAAITVNGELDEYEEDESFTVNGQEVRVDNIIQTSNDQSAGTVSFSIGSAEMTLSDGEPIQNDEDDDVDGTYVEFNGDSGSDSIDSVSSIDVYVGAPEDDEDAVVADETFVHDAFPGIEFQFGGLNPDSSEADSTEEIEFSARNDETIQVSASLNQDSNLDFLHYDGSSIELADDDGETIHGVEGAQVREDEYFITDAGGFSHYWETTGIDRDSTETLSSGDQATIDLTDRASGSDVEVTLDADTSNDVYRDTEIIDGQTYHFFLEGTGSDPYFEVAWGTDAGTDGSGVQTGGSSSGTTTAFPTLETENGGRLTFYEPSQDPSGLGLGTNLIGFNSLGDSEGNTGEFFIDDGTSTGSYETEDDILRATLKTNGATSTTYDGNAVESFGSNIYWGDSDHDGAYSSGEAIIDQSGGGSDSQLESGDTVITSGSLDLTNFGSAVNYYDDASDTGSYTDGEVIYDESGGTDDNTVAASETRITSVTVKSGSDTDVSTIDYGLNQLTSVKDTDEDAGKSLSSVSSASVDVVDTGGTSGTLEAGDSVFIDLGNDGTYNAEDPVLVDNGLTAGSSTTDQTLTGSWTEGEDGTNEAVIFDVGSNDGGGDADTDVYFSGGTGTIGDASTITVGSATGVSNPVKYFDVPGTSSGQDASDSVYIDMSGSGTVTDETASADNPDFRIRGFQTTYSAGSTVSAGDMDVGASLASFASSEKFTDDSGDSDVFENGEAIVSSADSNLDSGDTVVTSGSADLSDLSATSNLYVEQSGNSQYTDGEDIIAYSVLDTGSSSATVAGSNLNAFSSNIKHMDGGNSQFDSGETVVDDADGSDDYTTGDTVFGGSSGSVEYFSTDSEETNGVTSGLFSALPSSEPGAVFIEEETDSENQHGYVVTADYSSSEERLELSAPTFSDPSMRETDSLESNDDVTEGFDVFGAFTSYDSNEEGSLTISYPDAQAVVGAAFTAAGGSLSAGGDSSSVSMNPSYSGTGFPAESFVALDSEVSSPEAVGNMILVGGPAVNQLVADLAENNQTWTGNEYSEGDQVVDMVNDAFSQGQDALVVAGYSSSDTRSAAAAMANWNSISEKLSGKDTVNLATQ